MKKLTHEEQKKRIGLLFSKLAYSKKVRDQLQHDIGIKANMLNQVQATAADLQVKLNQAQNKIEKKNQKIHSLRSEKEYFKEKLNKTFFRRIKKLLTK